MPEVQDLGVGQAADPAELPDVPLRLVPPSYGIHDWGFINDLKRLKELRSFLLNEAINISPQDSAPLSFGSLNLLKFEPNGRAPTEEEWAEIEAHTQTLFGLLTEPLRRRFLLGQIPSSVSLLPIVFAALAIISLIAAIVVQDTGIFGLTGRGVTTLPFYLLWLVSLGAIGSVAFVGMNALSVQQDATFDIGNKRLMILRISLGALFGLVLTLPFGFSSFLDFIKSNSNSKCFASLRRRHHKASDVSVIAVCTGLQHFTCNYGPQQARGRDSDFLREVIIACGCDLAPRIWRGTGNLIVKLSTYIRTNCSRYKVLGQWPMGYDRVADG